MRLEAVAQADVRSNSPVITAHAQSCSLNVRAQYAEALLLPNEDVIELMLHARSRVHPRAKTSIWRRRGASPVWAVSC